MRTTNPFLLALIIGVVAYVVAARRTSAPWARSFGSFARLAVFVVVFRMMIQILVGERLPGTTLFTLPSVALPSWMAGVSLGGPVTLEALVMAFNQGLRLAAVLICFGAVNSLCSPYRMLRALPTALYEAGVAVTVALSFAPQAVLQAGRSRGPAPARSPCAAWPGCGAWRCRCWRGRSTGRSRFAASMDTRGYGRRATVAPRLRRITSITTGVGSWRWRSGCTPCSAGAPQALGLSCSGWGRWPWRPACSPADDGRCAPATAPDLWRLAECVVSSPGWSRSGG
jgi:energy-coupling factor transport system permease protein